MSTASPDPTPAPAWPALRAARRTEVPRRAVMLRAAAGPVTIGSVAEAHLPALAAWPQWVTVAAEAVTLDFGAGQSAIDRHWATLNEALRAQGLIVAWRDEPYGVWDERETSHATIERAASRFWGTLTLGAHCNGYVAGADGRPTHLWVAKRSLTKPTDPGKLDNLIGGGVPLGQSPWEALQREAYEEAGLGPDEIAQTTPGRIVALHCDIPEGLQREHLHVYDLRLPEDRTPQNQDGEVAWHRCWPVHEALAAAADGRFTTDAALATLDFALRHGLVPENDPLATTFTALLAGEATRL